MNNIVNYFKISIGKSKITYFVIFSVVVYNFIYYISFLQNTTGFYTNWYDLAISLFSSYMNIAYFYFTIFLLFIYNITSKSDFYKYIFLRLGSKKKWYFYNVINVVISSVLFTILIIAQTILEGMVTLSFRNKWSEYSIHITNPERIRYLYSPDTFSYVMNNMKPLKYIIISVFFILCFFCTIGFIYLIFSMVLKNKVITFFGVLAVNLINIFTYNFEISGFMDKSFYYNTAVITAEHKVLNNSIFYDRFLYWIILILGLIIIGNIIKSRIDFEYGDN